MATTPHPEAQYVSLRDAAKIYGVSVETLRRRISEGVLPAVKSGYKLIRVRLDDTRGAWHVRVEGSSFTGAPTLLETPADIEDELGRL